jgi:hypothetical protein
VRRAAPRRRPPPPAGSSAGVADSVIMLLLLLLLPPPPCCALLLLRRPIQSATVATAAPDLAVLNDTDFPDNCDHGGRSAYSHGTSALDCAAQCRRRPGCAASIWNTVGNPFGPESCCFKCRADNPIRNRPGIYAVVVRRLLNDCSRPPPPPPSPLVPPTDWEAGFLEGSLLLSSAAPDYADQAAVLHGSTPLGNGLIGTVVDLQSVYLGGVFVRIICPSCQPNSTAASPHAQENASIHCALGG